MDVHLNRFFYRFQTVMFNSATTGWTHRVINDWPKKIIKMRSKTLSRWAINIVQLSIERNNLELLKTFDEWIEFSKCDQPDTSVIVRRHWRTYRAELTRGQAIRQIF